MKNLWTDEEALRYSHSDLALRVYTSRLLGRDADLVLHGGGNTSVKTVVTNILGDREDILFVKGSGWDLQTIEEAGFSPARLRVLQRLGQLPRMTDTDMARELKASMTNPSAPAPSVEAILHAIIPHKYVDHTHTDAVVAISNTPDGEALLRKIYGARVLILPYVMPGFILAKQVYEATKTIDWKSIDGIFLLHHGLFTFHDDARTSYDTMIALVNKAEDYLKSVSAFDALAQGQYRATRNDCLQLALARQNASKLFGYPMLVRWKRDEFSVGYSRMPDIESIATRGPVTPDHTLHTKRTAMIVDNDPVASVAAFAQDYKEYFARNAAVIKNGGKLICLDPAPRFAVWKHKGCLAFGPNAKRANIVSDILDHTLKAVQWGEKLGGWTALPECDIFELEYWELEQAKLKSAPSRAEFEGKVALVTGAASGIGRACAQALMQKGAAVIALDINPEVVKQFSSANSKGIVCDMTSEQSIVDAVQEAVMAFGGIDIVVSNAGMFPPSLAIANMDSSSLQKSMTLNFSSHVVLMRECEPYLKLGFDPTIILMASKNVPAPGPAAGAYSAAKAALTQMGRVAALELGEHGIRVNMLHPNAVFDTGVWSDEVLAKRAAHYKMSVDEYKTNNLLKTEITSADVARLVVAMAGSAFAKTTGAQVPVDGGNDRVV
jgi:rhamnose utilization protein RhaD (predicted bifunctional aldolase and dehydrogenase)/NAD(P)-dependent dehydrogenase (short-subunit alcohol dehydrogenase family)